MNSGAFNFLNWDYDENLMWIGFVEDGIGNGEIKEEYLKV